MLEYGHGAGLHSWWILSLLLLMPWSMLCYLFLCVLIYFFISYLYNVCNVCKYYLYKICELWTVLCIIIPCVIARSWLLRILDTCWSVTSCMLFHAVFQVEIWKWLYCASALERVQCPRMQHFSIRRSSGHMAMVA